MYLAAYLRVLDDEVRSDTLMFFNSRKSHTFSVIQQLKTIGLLPARAWQQQSTKGALLWPANWSVEQQQLKYLQHLQHRSISTAVVVTTVSDGVYSTLPPVPLKMSAGPSPASLGAAARAG